MPKKAMAWGVVALVWALSGWCSAADIKMTVGDDALVTISVGDEDVWRMFPGVFSPGWKISQGYATEEGYPKKEADGTYTLRFTITPRDQEGVIPITTKVSLLAEGADLHYLFEFPQAFTLNSVFVMARFPVGPSGGKTLLLDDHKVGLPSGEYQKGMQHLFTGKAERIAFPIPNVPIEVSTEAGTLCVVHDQREWGRDDFQVRMSLLPMQENIQIAADTKLEKKITLRVPGLKSSSVGAQ